MNNFHKQNSLMMMLMSSMRIQDTPKKKKPFVLYAIQKQDRAMLSMKLWNALDAQIYIAILNVNKKQHYYLLI